MKLASVLAAALSASAFLAASARAEDAAPAPAPKVEAKEQGAIAWTDDLDAAKAQAAKEDKDILVDFTGSDWCHWCVKLKEEVFDQPDFAPAAGQFVFVEADFPSRKQLPAKVKARNEKLKQEFGVRGFPSVYLLDAKGHPFAKMGYQEGGPGPFLKAMEEARARRAARDAKWAQAAKAQGAAKAKLLDEGLQAIGDDKLVFAHYKAELVEAMKLDADGSAGVKARYEAKLKAAQAQKKFEDQVPQIMEAAEAQPEESIKQLRALAADKDMSTDFRQKALFLASQVCRAEIKDMARAEKIFDEAVAVAPDSEFGLQLQMHKAKVYPAK